MMKALFGSLPFVFLLGCAASGSIVPAPVTYYAQPQNTLPQPPQASAERVIGPAPVGPIDFFGIHLNGAQDIAFVLDCSGSMSGESSIVTPAKAAGQAGSALG